jgi:hypothetical protein
MTKNTKTMSAGRKRKDQSRSLDLTTVLSTLGYSATQDNQSSDTQSSSEWDSIPNETSTTAQHTKTDPSPVPPEYMGGFTIPEEMYHRDIGAVLENMAHEAFCHIVARGNPPAMAYAAVAPLPDAAAALSLMYTPAIQRRLKELCPEYAHYHNETPDPVNLARPLKPWRRYAKT